MFNPWYHVRLGGIVIQLIGAFTSNAIVVLCGIFLLFIGMNGGIDLCERRVALLEKILMSDDKEEK
jgi:uncharacterized membrane protein